MQIRRCAIVMFEPVARQVLDMALLLRGGAGLATVPQWQARAAHLQAPVPVDAGDVSLLGALLPEPWIDAASAGIAPPQLQRLLEAGLLVGDHDAGAAHRQRDDQVRAMDGWPLAMLMHGQGRWHGVDSAAQMREARLVTAHDLHARFGPPPAAVAAPVGPALPLPVIPDDARDVLLQQRATCRNFDPARGVLLDHLSRVLKRTVQAHAVAEPGHGMAFLKKNVPSGGGLHPLETYVLALQVDGLQAGLYHYHPVEHALRRLPATPATGGLPALALGWLAGQDWFAAAPLHMVQVARFPRSYWKYRHHPKAYRAVLLDAGHVSQQWMLSATELGLAAYVTAAINELDIEAALGLDGIAASPLMMCGLGWRADAQATAEFDPLHRVWPG